MSPRPLWSILSPWVLQMSYSMCPIALLLLARPQQELSGMGDAEPLCQPPRRLMWDLGLIRPANPKLLGHLCTGRGCPLIGGVGRVSQQRHQHC